MKSRDKTKSILWLRILCRQRTVSAVFAVATCVILSMSYAQPQTPAPAELAPVHSETHAGKCTWQPGQVFVVAPTITGDQKKALDRLLDKLVSAVGAAADEVSAVKKAIDSFASPVGDAPDVWVICECRDSSGNIIARKKLKVHPDDEHFWSAKTNIAIANGDKAIVPERQRVLIRLCRSLRR